MSAAGTAFADQADAAARQARAAVTGMSARESLAETDVPDAMHRIVRELQSAIAFGALRFCPHIDPAAPQPVTYLPWHPARVWCRPCTAALIATMPGTDEDHRCDTCGRRDTPVVPSITAIGAVIITAGFCATCCPEVHT